MYPQNNDNFGLHLTLDLSGCNIEKLKDISLIYDLLRRLPEIMRMQSITLPIVVKWLDKNATIDGISGIIMIAESHISIHTFPEKHYAFADVFSCRNFDTTLCTEEFTKLFRPKKFKKNLIRRGVDFNN